MYKLSEHAHKQHSKYNLAHESPNGGDKYIPTAGSSSESISALHWPDVLSHDTCGTGPVDNDPSFTTAGSTALSILFRYFKAISREAVTLSARLPLHQGVTVFMGVDLSLFFLCQIPFFSWRLRLLLL